MRNNSKPYRLGQIGKILEKRDVHTLEGLKKKLMDKKIRASLATLSRDLRELGYTRAPAGDGTYRIVKIEGRDEHIDLFFRLGLEDLTTVGNFVVIKTRPGNAQAVAGAIDRTHVEGIVGTVAGDDTIFAITRSPSIARRVVNQLKKYRE